MNVTEQKTAIQKVLGEFMRAWTVGDYQKMQERTTYTYRKANPKAKLKERLPFRVKNYRITHLEFANPVMADVHARVTYQGRTLNLYMRLIQEVAAFVPSQSGDWGVNPVSIREIVKEKDKAETAKT